MVVYIFFLIINLSKRVLSTFKHQNLSKNSLSIFTHYQFIKKSFCNFDVILICLKRFFLILHIINLFIEFYQLLYLGDNFYISSIMQYLSIFIFPKCLANNKYFYSLFVNFSHKKTNYLP